MGIYDTAFRFVMKQEGSVLSLDPRDPGNFTPAGVLKGSRYGISAREFPNEDIANMTPERAAVLAKPKYWDVNHCDELPKNVAILMLDSAYNQGTGDAARFLQRALGLPVDGAIGPKTIAAAVAADARHLARLFSVYRVIDYSEAGAWPTYKKGWLTRAFDAFEESLEW